MFGLSTLYVKLIGGVLAALVLAGLVADRGRWMHRAHGDEAQLSAICGATRDASENQKLACKDVPAQIAALGQTIATLKASLAKQNAAIATLGDQTKQQQQSATEALRSAQERVKAAQAVAQRLRDSAAHAPSGAASGACQPSKALQEQWP